MLNFICPDVGIDVTESASTTTTESSDLSVSKIKFTSSAAEDKSDSDSERSTAGEKIELSLLDLYSGCGAMSTGLCLGANLAGINLKTVSYPLTLIISTCLCLVVI